MTIHEPRGHYAYNDGITAEELRKHFHYDPVTGVFTRLTRKNSHGSIDRDGYLILKINRRQFKGHRMAWLYVYGVLPTHNIDHRNRIRADNRIDNLRDATQAVNVENTTRHPNPETGVIGVYIDRTRGLKKKYATKRHGKTYRFYSVTDALSFSTSHS